MLLLPAFLRCPGNEKSLPYGSPDTIAACGR
jgi:hypothetical protein